MNIRKQKISVIVPVYNERESVDAFHKELVAALYVAKKRYEIIYIDDHSTDGTFEYLKTVSTIPRGSGVKIFRKEGKKGKAY